MDDALNQLAARLKSLEGSVGPTPDASAITYTPTTNSDWTGSADPGNVDDALDQVAGRVKVLETHYAAGDLPYTQPITPNGTLIQIQVMSMTP